MAKSSSAPSKEILEAALQGLEAQKEKLDEQIAEVRRLIGRGGSSSSGGGRPSRSRSNGGGGAAATTKKRTLSPEARKRIAAAQKKRWAAFRKNQE